MIRLGRGLVCMMTAGLILTAHACMHSYPSRLAAGGSEGIEVRLLDLEGSPLPATLVKFVLDRRQGRSAQEAERVELRGKTDGAGYFELGYPKVWGDCAWSVWADLGDGWRLVEAGSGRPELPLAQVRRRDFEFRFRVHDEAGEPVQGASVHLVAGEESAPLGHLPARTTDARGELRWEKFAYGAWWVDISSPGYAPVWTCPYLFRSTDAPDRQYAVQLRAGRKLVVAVLGEDGRSVAGAEVEFAYQNLNLPTSPPTAAG
jgi:uncharacterized GH25 family protein